MSSPHVKIKLKQIPLVFFSGLFGGWPLRGGGWFLHKRRKNKRVFLHIFGAFRTENVDFAAPKAPLRNFLAILRRYCCLKWRYTINYSRPIKWSTKSLKQNSSVSIYILTPYDLNHGICDQKSSGKRICCFSKNQDQ